MANYYRMKAMDLHNEICNAIAQIIPAEGIVFNAAFRDEMEDSGHVIPSLTVIDDDNNCAYQSRPTWARGLKRLPCKVLIIPCLVAPHVGAWIETLASPRPW